MHLSGSQITKRFPEDPIHELEPETTSEILLNFLMNRFSNRGSISQR